MERNSNPESTEEQTPASLYKDMLHTDYGLYDLVPYDDIKAILEAHQKVVGVPVGLVSPESEPLINIGWQAICEEFHRKHPETCKACHESNRRLQKRLFEDEMVAEKCTNGLWDIAMPIMVGKRHLATVFIGQFFFDDETVDIDFFRTRARQFGFDETGYLTALDAVPRVSRDHVSEIIDYTAALVGLLADLGLKNLQLTREINERKMAEYALVEGERRYRALIENVPGAVYVCLNDDAYTTIFMSEAIEDITGVSAQSMIDNASSLLDMIHPEDRPAVVRLINEGVAQERPYVINYRLRRKAGTYLLVEERGQGVRDEAGVVRFLQGIIFDLSERTHFEEQRRNIEAQMARAHKLESLGVLAGGIAHDFNNLLVGILGHAELARDDVLRDSPAYESMDAIISAAHNAADLTHKMLAYSGKGHFNTEIADLSAVVRNAQPLLHTKSLESCDLHFELAENLPPVCVDVGQINQMLLGLANNAAEAYGEDYGDIYLRTGITRYDQSLTESSYLAQEIPEGDYVYLEVADAGCGMDAETKRRLCDPFFSTKFTGRGLSMAAVLGIVRGHNAHLCVDSEPGNGTAIRIYFPVSVYEKQDGADATPSPAERRAHKVLLVDDEAIVRNAAQKMLKRAGFAVLLADSGMAALDLVARHDGDISCVILDLTMPNLNGEETLHEIRKICPDMRIIISSGYTRENAEECLSEYGVSHFLHKPYDMSTLTTVLNHVLKEKR